jgi:hypothetical protein
VLAGALSGLAPMRPMPFLMNCDPIMGSLILTPGIWFRAHVMASTGAPTPLASASLNPVGTWSASDESEPEAGSSPFSFANTAGSVTRRNGFEGSKGGFSSPAVKGWEGSNGGFW